ncbi:MAG: rhodanese-like domain-containing protein [Alphaproteobacteria bacterium]|nr:rhodanese-like domain-containing protein [Alphaproteobacteria bacterium]
MSPRIQTIDAHTLHDWIEKDEALLIDVREAQEHARAHIPAAILQPLSRLGAEALPEANGRRVVICCASGARSLMAADRMLADRYGSVCNLDGGIAAWQLAGYEVAQDENATASAFPGLFSLFRSAG